MSSTETNPNTNDHNSGSSLSNQPFAWVLIPVVIFIFIGIIATIVQIRRRRRRRATLQWPGLEARAAGTTRPARTTRRGMGLAATRSDEGLNELGEAPPPYDGNKDVRHSDEMELRDMEAGVRPPDYPAEPAPAVTTESRRSL
ncbi:hypothetical protein QQZ08_001644 [Neonectria magnoliae]|uniref:Uncharacterized protein n=1 Tax=Neonectria magnoliae TaxID=2732573 RepID=A0ABR1IFD9_9HYPO